jgi:hypothetical protein
MAKFVNEIFSPIDWPRSAAALPSERRLWIEHIANPMELSPIARWEDA